MKPLKFIKASVLATVLVVGTLMLLVVFVLLSLSDIESVIYYGGHSRKQKQAWIDSAFTIYERDSTLINSTERSADFLIFDDEPSSEVSLSVSYWGLYELVKVSAEGGKFRSARLMGYAAESRLGAALYVCDDMRTLSLAGKSDIIGTVYVPRKEVLYGQVQSTFFSGKPIPAGSLRQSSADFPALNGSIADSVRNLAAKGAGAEYFTEREPKTVGFFEPLLLLNAGDLRGANLRGNIIIFGDGLIEIDSTAILEDVIVVAPRIKVRSGFSGSVQIIARDTVIVEPRAALKYPSGIAMCDVSADSYIETATNSLISGYIIIKCKKPPLETKRTANYKQQPGAVVRGLVYIDGIAEIHGTITGSLFVNHPNYYTPQGFYSNILYDASVYGNNIVAYPIWMESNHLRKTVKWLY